MNSIEKQYEGIEPNDPAVREGGNPTLWLHTKANQLALDLGCGGGFDCAKLAAAGCSTVGIDIQQKMIHYARKHNPGAHYLVADYHKLPFGINTFDVVVSNCALLYSSDKKRAIAEAVRVLKPSGQLCIADGVDSLGVSFPTAKQYCALLQQYTRSVEIVEVRPHPGTFSVTTFLLLHG